MSRIYIRTFGCPLNKFDEMNMEYYLINNGHSIVSSPDSSEVIIINTCGVKKQTEDRIVDYIKYLNKKFSTKKLVISGCLSLINKKRLLTQVNFNIMTGPSLGENIVKVVNMALNSNTNKFILKSSKEEIRIPRTLYLKRKKVAMPVAASYGCLDKCSFCGTKFARGYVKSLETEKIINLIRYLTDNGVKEIFLTSTDLGAYGFDLKPRKNMIDLLSKISEMKGNFIVRIGMANPRWIYKWLDDLIELFNITNKFYYFLHIPVQSGSEKMLKIMNRGHGVEEYIESVKRIRKEVDPLFSISTDIIVGHPGEEDNDFQQTINIIKESMPDFVNISKFFPRPNTPAKYMKQVPTDIIKRRSIEITQLVDQILINRNMKWVGWEGPVLINEHGKNGSYMTRNYAYKIIVLNGNYSLGDIEWVKVDEAKVTWLKAQTIQKTSSTLNREKFYLHIS